MTPTEARFLAFHRTINAANFILKLPALTASEAHRAWCEIQLEQVRGCAADVDRMVPR
jgi:hypothetical protein